MVPRNNYLALYRATQQRKRPRNNEKKRMAWNLYGPYRVTQRTDIVNSSLGYRIDFFDVSQYRTSDRCYRTCFALRHPHVACPVFLCSFRTKTFMYQNIEIVPIRELFCFTGTVSNSILLSVSYRSLDCLYRYRIVLSIVYIGIVSFSRLFISVSYLDCLYRYRIVL